MSVHNLKKLAKAASRYCVGMEGNISGKVNDDLLLIKASGTRLDSLEYEDLVAFDFNGKQISNLTKKGSMELGFHTFLLSFKNIRYVSHTHPVNALKILCSSFGNSFAETRIFPDQVIFNGGKSCFIPYAKPGQELTDLIKIKVTSFIKDEGYFPKLILLENHGIITCGETVDECIIASDICEKSAEIFMGASTLASVKILTKNQITDLLNDTKEKYRQQQLK